MTDYESVLAGKHLADDPSGFDPKDWKLTNSGDRELFPFQDAIVRWALKRGRAAIFADTGLGKTAMQVAWAYAVHQYTGNRVLILAPLCVAQQTVAEAAHFGITIRYVREMPEERETGIYICPLQLDLIERCLFLWSNPGDLVYSPFAGIGSEGYVACAMGRRFVGSELKRSYFELAKQNLADSPRSQYRFPYFQKSIGKWQPGEQGASAIKQGDRAQGTDQLDIMDYLDRPDTASEEMQQ